MANSVSKINVVVGANTSQLQSGMRQAAATVQAGMGNVQTIAQQATFAVDDFFAAFATGGVAGGLRGAGNNLTMIAASLGGIKAQLAVIAGLSIAQLFAKQWDAASDATRGATDELKGYANELKRVSGMVERNQKFRQSARDIGTIRSLPDAFRSQQSGRQALQDIEAQLQENDRRLAELAMPSRDSRLVNSVIATQHDNPIARRIAPEMFAEIDAARERQKLVKEEEESRRSIRQSLLDEIQDQKRLNEEVDRRLQLLQFDRSNRINVGAAARAGGVPAGMSDIAEIDKEIQRLRAGMGASLSMSDMFRLLPGANQLGSVGGISAISAAMTGPQNARDSGPALQRQTNAILERIEELEKRKKGILEVVGL